MLAFFFNFQDMPAKLGFNRRGNLAGSCFKGDFSKFWYHTLARKPSQIAALLAGSRVF